MLFDTERKAQAFIEFNREDIAMTKRHVPTRSYYCNVCFGWHVTHSESEEFFKGHKSKAEQLVEDYLGGNKGPEKWEIQLNRKVCESQFPDNVRICLCAALKHEDRSDILDRAFKLMCDGLSRQIASGEVTDLFMNMVKNLMKRMRKAHREIGGDEDLYNRTTKLHEELRAAFADHGTVLIIPPTEEEKEMKRQEREENKRRKQECTLKYVAMRISSIIPCIEDGKQLFAKNEIACALYALSKLAKSDFLRDELLEQVDNLIAARTCYEAKYGKY